MGGSFFVSRPWLILASAEGQLVERAVAQDASEQMGQIRGWLFLDQIHADEAENTTPGRKKNWRATAWELHPVTSIEVLAGPPG